MTLTDLLDERTRADYNDRYPHGWRASWEPEGIVIRFVVPREEDTWSENQSGETTPKTGQK